jgi:hypothetical protein
MAADRAAITTVTILGIVRRALGATGDLASARAEIEDVLRDEFHDVEREIAFDRAEFDLVDIDDADPVHSDLYDAPPQTVRLKPCGRGLGPCIAIIERNQIRCLACGVAGPRPTIFDGFIQSELKFLHSRIAPGDPGNNLGA